MPALEGDDYDLGQALAVKAEALYLANLLLLPVVSFSVLLYLYIKHSSSAPQLAVCHLKQTVNASLWAGALLIIANVAILLLGGYTSVNTWIVAIIYFTICHSSLVVLGMMGLAKAMAGQSYIYPLLGKLCNG